MTPRRWGTLSAICFLAAAYYLCYEHFPVYVTKDTPLFRATRNGRQGLVTTGRRIVVPFECTMIQEVDDSGLVDLVREDSEGNATIDVRTLPGLNEAAASRTELSGIGPTIDFIWAPVTIARFDSFGLMAVKSSSGTGWMNQGGDLQLQPPAGHHAVSSFYPCGLAVVESSGGLQGCIDRSGQLVMPAQWQTVEPISVCPPDQFLLQVSDGEHESDSNTGRSRVIASDGQEILSDQYQLISTDVERRMLVTKDRAGRFGVVDFSGHTIIPFKYQRIGPFGTTGYAWAQRDDKFGWIDTAGSVVVPFLYDGAHSSVSFQELQAINHGELILMHQAFKGYGALDASGQEVVSAKFSEAVPIFNDLSVVAFTDDRHKSGLIDATGRILVPFDYDALGKGILGYCIGVIDTPSPTCVIIDRNGTVFPMADRSRLDVLVSEVLSDRPDRNPQAHEEDKSNQDYWEISKASGKGVYHMARGEIVPAVHGTVWRTRCGFRGMGLTMGKSPLERYSVWFMRKLDEFFPSLIIDCDDVEIFYDFRGEIIWRSDARFGDLVKAFGLSCWGLYCFRRYRIAKRKQRTLPAGC